MKPDAADPAPPGRPARPAGRSRLRWRRLLVTLMVAAVLTAAAGQPASPTPRAVADGIDTGAAVGGTAATDNVLEGETAAVRRLLAARSAAVVDGDTEAMAALIAADAPEDFRLRQLRLAAATAALPPGTYVEELAEPVLDLTPPSVRAAIPMPVMVVEVVRRQRFEGYDPSENVTSTYLTLVDPDGEGDWVVRDDTALRSVGVVGERYLWELFDVGSVATDRVLVIGTTGEPELRRLAGEVEQAIDRFDEVWTRPWWGRIVVLSPADVAELEALLDPTVDVSKFVAFTTLRVDRSRGWEVAAPRLVIQQERFGRRSGESRVRVLVHELAHVATVADSGPMTPLWVHEGLASWVEKGRPTESGEFGGFPDSHEFRTGSRSEIAAAYAEAADDMAAMAGTLGADAPIEFFERLGAVRGQPGTPDHHLNRILESTEL